ncbi:MAG: hypothetical protein WC532_02280 [Candidatus Omnitrophota bacterium]
MIVFLLMNLVVVFTALLLAYKIFKYRSPTDLFIASFILYLSQAISTQLILGIINALTLENVILLNSAIALGAWFFCRRKKASLDTKEIREEAGSLLKNKVVMLAIAVILGFGITKTLVNLVNPPFGWDDLNYHFTFAVEWLKHANLGMPITVSDDPSPPYYPINGSLFFLWLIWPFKSVFMADLGQVPFFILAFVSVYGISKKIGLTPSASFLAASLFSLIPNYFKQLQIAYVDVMVSSLFLACLNFLFILKNDLSIKNTLICAMGLGLLLGTKTVALPYSILLIAPFLCMLVKNKKKAGLLLIFLTAATALGAFSYLRNFLETGNPLYPLNLQAFGKTIFKGVMDAGVYRAHFKPEDYRITKLLFHEGMGLQTIVFIFPAALLALPLAIIKNRAKAGALTIYFLALPLLGYLLYRYAIPLANTRYLYPVLACGMVAGFYLIKAVNIPTGVVSLFCALSLVASMAELAKQQELIASLIFVFLLLLLLRIIPRIRKPLLLRWQALAVIAACVVIAFLVAAEKYYQRNEFKNYLKMVKYSGFWPDAARAWEWLNENTGSANIAYTGRPVPFPLYGKNFKNNVYYVSVNRVDPPKLHYFPDSRYSWGGDFKELHKNLEKNGNYRGNADYSAWLANLLKRKTDYLFIYSFHQTKETGFPIEERWATGNPGRFTPVFRNETIRIFKLIR